MSDAQIMLVVGLALTLLAILLLIREKRIFGDTVMTSATVVKYYDYRGTSSMVTMYTMAVEYHLENGSLMHAKEQSGASSQKYPVGTVLQILYSRARPELFTVSGDHSRQYVLWGMLIVGVAMTAIFGRMVIATQ